MNKYTSICLVFLMLFSCSKNKDTALEKEYRTIVEKENNEHMKEVVEENRLNKIKAKRWLYGAQQLSWVAAARDSGLIDKDVFPKKTASAMRNKISAWMKGESDDKPYFGDPKQIPELLKKAGKSDAQISQKMSSINPLSNPYTEYLDK